jgi:predicted thioesterase
MPVLATPRVLALAERAMVAAVAGALEAGATTVGTRVELEHLAPSLVGADLAVEAVLERVDGRQRGDAGAGYPAGAGVRAGGRLVARGMVTRVVVDTGGFLRDAGAGVGG